MLSEILEMITAQLAQIIHSYRVSLSYQCFTKVSHDSHRHSMPVPDNRRLYLFTRLMFLCYLSGFLACEEINHHINTCTWIIELEQLLEHFIRIFIQLFDYSKCFDNLTLFKFENRRVAKLFEIINRNSWIRILLEFPIPAKSQLLSPYCWLCNIVALLRNFVERVNKFDVESFRRNEWADKFDVENLRTNERSNFFDVENFWVIESRISLDFSFIRVVE